MPVLNSATVETLTAEVRVLMVGSRQVTLSVFRQLDWVEWDECTPFGRVNEGEGRVAVGKNLETGALVRARLYPAAEWDSSDTYTYQGLLRERQQILKSIMQYGKDMAYNQKRLAEYDAIINDETKPLEDRGDAERSRKYLRGPEDPSPKLEAIDKRLKEMEDWKARAEKNVLYNRRQVASFNTLPLIVLAGLR